MEYPGTPSEHLITSSPACGLGYFAESPECLGCVPVIIANGTSKARIDIIQSFKFNFLNSFSRLIAIGVFNLLAIVGAAVAIGISGTIAAYIVENKDDPDNDICNPGQVYPPIFTDVGQDCK